MYCNECGKKLEDGSKFCPICGNSVAAPITTAAVPPTSPTAAPALPLDTSKIFTKYGRHISSVISIYLLFLPLINVYKFMYVDSLSGNINASFSLKNIFEFSLKVHRIADHLSDESIISSYILLVVTGIFIILYIIALINVINAVKDLVRENNFEINNVVKQWKRMKKASILMLILILLLWISLSFVYFVAAAIAEQAYNIDLSDASDIVEMPVKMSGIYYFTLAAAIINIVFINIRRKADIALHATPEEVNEINKSAPKRSRYFAIAITVLMTLSFMIWFVTGWDLRILPDLAAFAASVVQLFVFKADIKQEDDENKIGKLKKIRSFLIVSSALLLLLPITILFFGNHEITAVLNILVIVLEFIQIFIIK